MATWIARGLGWGALLLTLSLPVAAQTTPRFRVQISVKADKVQLERQFTSYASRGLRSLGDVEVVDTLADYTLYFSLAKVTLGKHLGGYAVSMAVTRWVDRYNCFLGTQLHVTSVTDLRTTAESFITSFNTEILRYRRQAALSRPR